MRRQSDCGSLLSDQSMALPLPRIQKRPIAESIHVESRLHVIKGPGLRSWLCPYGNLQKIMSLDKMSWFL